MSPLHRPLGSSFDRSLYLFLRLALRPLMCSIGDWCGDTMISVRRDSTHRLLVVHGPFQLSQCKCNGVLFFFRRLCPFVDRLTALVYVSNRENVLSHVQGQRGIGIDRLGARSPILKHVLWLWLVSLGTPGRRRILRYHRTPRISRGWSDIFGHIFGTLPPERTVILEEAALLLHHTLLRLRGDGLWLHWRCLPTRRLLARERRRVPRK